MFSQVSGHSQGGGGTPVPGSFRGGYPNPDRWYPSQACGMGEGRERTSVRPAAGGGRVPQSDLQPGGGGYPYVLSKGYLSSLPGGQTENITFPPTLYAGGKKRRGLERMHSLPSCVFIRSSDKYLREFSLSAQYNWTFNKKIDERGEYFLK